jgi:hypothetical protein
MLSVFIFCVALCFAFVMLGVVMLDVIIPKVTVCFEWSFKKLLGKHCCVINISPDSHVLKHFE